MQANPPVDPKDLKKYDSYYLRSKVDFTPPPGGNGPLQFQNISMKKEWLGGTWNDRYKETNWETLEDPPKKLAFVQNNWFYFKFSNGEGGYFTEPTVEDIRPAKLRIEEYTPVYDLQQYRFYFVRRKKDFESFGYPTESGYNKPLQFLGFTYDRIQEPSLFLFQQGEYPKKKVTIPKDDYYYFEVTENLDDVPSHKNLEWRLQYRKRARTLRRKNKRSKSRRN